MLEKTKKIDLYENIVYLLKNLSYLLVYLYVPGFFVFKTDSNINRNSIKSY